MYTGELERGYVWMLRMNTASTKDTIYFSYFFFLFFGSNFAIWSGFSAEGGGGWAEHAIHFFVAHLGGLVIKAAILGSVGTVHNGMCGSGLADAPLTFYGD